MNALVVSGCTVAGACAGVALDLVAARFPPATDPIDAGVNAETSAKATSAAADADGAAAPGACGGDRRVQDDPEGVAAKAARHDPVSEELTEAARLIPGPPGIAELVGAGVVTAVLFGAAAIRFGPVPALAPYCVFFGGLVALSIADIRVGLVPRKILYPTLGLMVVGLVAASVVNDDWWALARAAIGGTGAFFVFVGIYVLYPRGMGFGDVRLAGVMGVGLGWLGFQQIYAGFLVGFLAGALYGGVKMVVAGSGRKTRFPFGPGLAFGAVIGVLFGGWLATFWLLHST